MNRGLRLSIAAMLAFAAASCTLGGTGSSGGVASSQPTGTGVSVQTPNAALQSLPDLALQVPGSLDDQSLKLKLKLKSPGWGQAPRFFANGDISNFSDASSLPDVKSEGWVKLQKSLTGEDSDTIPVRFLVAILKEYASNHTIAYNTNLSLGSYPLWYNDTNMEADLGTFRFVRETTNRYHVYWTLALKINSGRSAANGTMAPVRSMVYGRQMGTVAGGGMYPGGYDQTPHMLFWIHMQVDGDRIGDRLIQLQAKMSNIAVFTNIQTSVVLATNADGSAKVAYVTTNIFTNATFQEDTNYVDVYYYDTNAYTNLDYRNWYNNNNVYAVYDESIEQVVDFNIWSNQLNFKRSKPDGSGGIVLENRNLSSWEHGFNSNTTIAWGNDQYGGLINLYENQSYQYVYSSTNGQWNYDYNTGVSTFTPDDPLIVYTYTNPASTYSGVNSEYYDNKGSLVLQNYGYTSSYDYSSYYTNNALNLLTLGIWTPPDTVGIRVFWSNSAYYLSAQASNQAWTDPVLSTNGWWGNNVILKYNPNVKFQPGEAYYWMTVASNIYDGNGNWQGTYYGYTANIVPSPSLVFDKYFTLENRWPLKYTSLDPSYNGYGLYRLTEYDSISTNIYTNSTWDFVGMSNIYPNPLVVQTNIYDYSQYKWFMNNRGSNTFDSTNDILLQNVVKENYYLFNPVDYSWKSVDFYVVKGFGDTPKYFNFNSQGVVNSVKTRLNAYYWLGNTFDAQMFVLSNVPTFPILSNFPPLQGAPVVSNVITNIQTNTNI